MEDEASILLDGKTLGNLRVVDLKQELEKRGLSKSGSKKDLVKRLKVQLEFEKLCGERKTAGECDLKLELDADTEQNEFVQQYLAQQQKIYAEQKEVKRLVELEETLKSSDEKESCDSTKGDDEVTGGGEGDDDDDQTEPDEPSETDSDSELTHQKVESSCENPSKTEIQKHSQISSVASPTNEGLVGSTVSSENGDDQENPKASSEIIHDVPVDSSIENAETCVTNVHQEEKSISSEITQEPPADSSIECTSNCNTVIHRGKQAAAEILQNVPVDSSFENIIDSTHQEISSEIEDRSNNSRETILSPKSEPSSKMEPATQFSTVPYSLLDIQLPESPENIKPSKTTSDHVSNSQSVDSQSMIDDNQSNGVDSTSTENNLDENSQDKKSSNKAGSFKNVESHDNSVRSGKHSDKDSVKTCSKESNSDDSKNESSSVSHRSQSKKSFSDHKHSVSKKDSNDQKGTTYTKDSRAKEHNKKVPKSREDSPIRRDSRSRSREKNRRAHRSRKDSDSRKTVSDHRDSRSRSKESDCKSHNSNLDSKRYKTTHGHRKSRSQSSGSRTDKNSESDDEYHRRKLKSKETKRKRKDRKRESDSDCNKKSRSRDNSPQATHKRKTYSSRQKDRRHKSESSEDSESSRSRSPVKRKPGSKSDEPLADSVAAGKHNRRKVRQRGECSEGKQSSRSKSREGSPAQKKSKSKQAESKIYSDKQKEKSYRSSDEGQNSRSRSRESSPIKKTSKSESNEPVVSPKSASEEEKEYRRRDSRVHKSRSKSRESSPINKKSKSKLEELHSAESVTKSTRQKKKQRSKSSEGSRSPERSPVVQEHRSKSDKIHTELESMSRHDEKEDKIKGDSSTDSPGSRSRSRESSPVPKQTFKETNKQSHDFQVSRKHRRHKEKDPGNEHSDEDHASKSKSRENSPNRISKRNDEPSEKATAFEHIKHDGHSSDEQDDSLVPKKSKSSSGEPDIDLKTSDKELLADDVASEKDEKRNNGVTAKSSSITVIKKEPVRQKLKIKRDNISSLSQNKKDIAEKSELAIESKSEKSDISEATVSVEENKIEVTKVPAPYVSRKITLSRRTLSQTSDDEPKNKKSKWGSFASSQKTSQTINISTNSLKNWFPDFKLLKDPVPEETISFSKDETDMEISTNRMDEDPRHNPRKTEESRLDAVMNIPPEDMGSVTKILFIQNLVRPFTLNQLKELLRETGNFVEEDFWIDKIKSKCFVTYETEEEAMKTKHALNGTRWPSSNPKILFVEYSNEEELEIHRSGSDLSKPIQQPAPEPTAPHDSRSAHVIDEYHKKDHDQDRKRDRSKHQPPMREWDKDKITQDSPDREHVGRDAEKTKSMDKKEKKDSKRRTNEDTPAKLLDDLFQKTKSSPCIYWLPLTDDQVQERTESRRLRRLEREKRNQQREQEDAENKSKRPRSRNRTKETETRRSSSRSRSPIIRRR
ncbi:apoptotic chromatin condensation inducer in the nucleus [Nephila pilipes]|uniref:Apoptotic chromatin condensation inducer in the nucleus n=1 Tax=Nephila pilipes TaxID=299642 RepID=A0A8X6TNN9_NEPPI|nr:apoptotic chromatin condensation inducer in the nucleus [Nephila pilipes]